MLEALERVTGKACASGGHSASTCTQEVIEAMNPQLRISGALCCAILLAAGACVLFVHASMRTECNPMLQHRSM